MKNKASSVVKQIISLLSSIVKSKIMGVKSKADAMRARLVVFSLMKNERPSLSSISHKIHALLDRKLEKDDTDLEEENRAIVLYNNATATDVISEEAQCCSYEIHDVDDDDKYPDLTHSLFEEEEDEELNALEQQASGSIVDMVKSSKEHQGQDFVLEDEIDHVADLFIRRFRKQIRLQKLESFKRYQEMLERSV